MINKLFLVLAVSTTLLSSVRAPAYVNEAKALLRHQNAGACEAGNAAYILEMAAALEKHEGVIRKTLQSGDDAKRSFDLDVYLDEFTGRRIGWRDQGLNLKLYSWGLTYEAFEAAKNNPEDPTWADIARFFNGLISADQDRLNGVNSELGFSDGPRLARAAKLLEECLHMNSCDTINDRESVDLLSGNTVYNWFYSRAKSEKSAARKVAYLSQLQQRINFDLQARFGFRRLESAVRLSPGEIQIPVDPGALSKERVSKILEYWSSPKLKVTFAFTSPTRSAQVVHFRKSAALGARTRVELSTLTIVYREGATVGDIAHELGHVLGFPDHYFEVWDSSRCRYIDQIFPQDLMATPTGQVTSEEWAELDRQYPWNPHKQKYPDKVFVTF